MKINTATLELTHKCNFHCKHCSISAGKEYHNELSFNEIKGILDQLNKLKVEKIELTGGEPLLRKDLNKIIKYSKKLNFKIKLLTNGFLLSEEKLKEFENLRVDGIAISLDGVNYETYNEIRQVNRRIFDRVLRNIKLASDSNLFVKINTVVTKYNFRELQKIANFCDRNKINELRICFLTQKGRAKNLDQKVELEKWLKIAKKLKSSKTKVYVGFSHAPFEGDCLLNEEIPLYISSNGDIFLCPLLKSIGNIRQTKLNKILNFNQTAKSCLGKPIKGLNPICPLRKFNISELK